MPQLVVATSDAEGLGFKLNGMFVMCGLCMMFQSDRPELFVEMN